jgi:hypothetical protein
VTGGGRTLLAALILSAIVIAGCGSQERVFTPVDFLDTINATGADLSLGPVLTTTSEGVDVYVLKYSADATTDPKLSSGDEGAATMIALDNSDQARSEFTRCQAAPLLTCFRAANVVLRFEDMSAAEMTRIVGALQAIEKQG